MKKYLILLFAAAFMFACSSDEEIVFEDENANSTSNSEEAVVDSSLIFNTPPPFWHNVDVPSTFEEYGIVPSTNVKIADIGKPFQTKQQLVDASVRSMYQFVATFQCVDSCEHTYYIPRYRTETDTPYWDMGWNLYKTTKNPVLTIHDNTIHYFYFEYVDWKSVNNVYKVQSTYYSYDEKTGKLELRNPIEFPRLGEVKVLTVMHADKNYLILDVNKKIEDAGLADNVYSRLVLLSQDDQNLI